MFEKIAHKKATSARGSELNTPLISRGDLLNLAIHDMPGLNGVIKVAANGEIQLPYGRSLQVTGLTLDEVSAMIRVQLKEMDWFNTADISLSVSVVRLSSISVSVFGAIFNPGRVEINAAPAMKPEQAVIQSSGAYSHARDLVSAITAAGGVRPDAKLTNVILRRNDKIYSFDLTTLLSGSQNVETPSLIDGDEIFIHSRGEEHTGLIRPSQITPPGMRVLMSNLTAPALNNAQSAVGADATRLPYGASMLDAALSANCVGGTHQANASRSILLITRHYGSMQQLVIRRSINQLLANSSDYAVNVFLMPNDGVACYDSKFTNIRDVARGLGEVFGPILLGRLF